MSSDTVPKTTESGYSQEISEILKVLTTDRAQEVRNLRKIEHYTWRRIAEDCHANWGGGWSPPANSVIGALLCQESAKLLGEEVDSWDT